MLTPDVLPDIGPDELRSRVLQRSGVLRRRRMVMRAAPIALVVMVAAVVLTDGGPARRVRTVPPADNAPLHDVDNSSNGSGEGAVQSQSVPGGPTVSGGSGGGAVLTPGGVPAPRLPGGGSPPAGVVDNGSPFPYTNDLVVFDGPPNSAGGVYTMNSDGSGRHQIPLPQQTASRPALSPNRNMVAYVAIAVVGADTRGVFVAGLDGSGSTLVATAPRHFVESVRWMPDGFSLVFTTWGEAGGQSGSFVGNGETEIYRVTLDGRLTMLAKGWAPQPSPDGTRIAYRPPGGAKGPWMMNADGTGARQLAPSDWTAFEYAWSPDGRTLAYAEAEDGSEDPPRLTLLDVSTGRARAILSDVKSPSWSPDGKAFAFFRTTSGQKCTPVVGCSTVNNGRIWTARADGTGARQLSPESSDDSGPQFPAHASRGGGPVP